MQDTLCERSAPCADAERRQAAGEAAGRTHAIEQSIAQTLAELDADDSGPFDLGTVPLDGPEAPLPEHSWCQQSARPRARGRHSNEKRHSNDGSGSRLILMAMVVSALLALGMVTFAFAEGFIP
jgi:hypothetical protein